MLTYISDACYGHNELISNNKKLIVVVMVVSENPLLLSK